MLGVDLFKGTCKNTIYVHIHTYVYIYIYVYRDMHYIRKRE